MHRPLHNTTPSRRRIASWAAPLRRLFRAGSVLPARDPGASSRKSARSAIDRLRASATALPFAGLLLIALTFPAESQVPRRLTYQGTLSENGSALTGHVSARFALYPDSVSSRILWQETVPIEVSGGTFTAELGAAAPLPDSLFAQPTLFLGIRIDADDEMRPRHRVTSVAYALRSAQAENVDDRAITPRSLTLKSGRASFGASGNIVGSTASVDSLVVGGTPVVGSGGRWVGPPVPALPAGLKLDTLIVRQTADTLLFLPIGTWQRIDTFSAAFRLGTVSTVEIVFAGALTANGSLETRVALRSLDPLGKASAVTNLSGILPPASGELRSSAFSNLGARTLDPGTYEVYAEERLQSSQAGRMHTGTLLIRLYRR